jgi:hypothetical protein
MIADIKKRFISKHFLNRSLDSLLQEQYLLRQLYYQLVLESPKTFQLFYGIFFIIDILFCIELFCYFITDWKKLNEDLHKIMNFFILIDLEIVFFIEILKMRMT